MRPIRPIPPRRLTPTPRLRTGACGWLKDRYGLCWQIVPTVFFEMISDSDPATVTRVTQAMFTMTKFDIAALEQAYAAG